MHNISFLLLDLLFVLVCSFLISPFENSIGQPQLIQDFALSDISFPHSGHFISAIILSSSRYNYILYIVLPNNLQVKIFSAYSIYAIYGTLPEVLEDNEDVQNVWHNWEA